MKVERNDPCPCGSGLKYKKCCLRKDEERTVAAAERLAGVPAVPPGDPGILPYTVARLVELETGEGSGRGRKARKRLRDRWTISRVASLATEDIEERLDRLGIPDARQSLVELAEGRDSGWSVGDMWTRRSPVRDDDDDIDFICLAACELWKRLLPDRPSLEMIDDWMQEGYQHDAAGRHVEAARIWWLVWRTLRPRFLPEMRTMTAADPVFSGTQCLFNWCQDFEMCLGNASARDPELAGPGKQYCTEWIAQFPDEDGHTRLSFQRALAMFQFRLGETRAGEATLQGLIERWPDDVWGYVALAEAYGRLWPEDPGPPRDLPRALDYIDRGFAVVTDPDDRAVLLERRWALRREADG